VDLLFVGGQNSMWWPPDEFWHVHRFVGQKNEWKKYMVIDVLNFNFFFFITSGIVFCSHWFQYGH
jgi:hypothetical protein